MRYSAGFWICLISEYTRVVNILGFWICQGSTRLWIKNFMTDLWQCSEYALDSEYANVFKYLGLHMVLNKILHHRQYLKCFWICIEFWTCQCHTGFCRKQPIMHVWRSSEYSSGCQYARAWRYKGYEYANVKHGSA